MIFPIKKVSFLKKRKMVFYDEGCGVTDFGGTAGPVPPVGAEATHVVAANCNGRDGIRGVENGH
jgi:hypothetical protein